MASLSERAYLEAGKKEREGGDYRGGKGKRIPARNCGGLRIFALAGGGLLLGGYLCGCWRRSGRGARGLGERRNTRLA